MQYLPEILKLQRYLFDHFHQQIGQEKALSETIGNYKKTIQKGVVDNFEENCKSFSTKDNHLFNYNNYPGLCTTIVCL